MDTSASGTDLMGAPIQSGATTLVVTSHDNPTATVQWIVGAIVVGALLITIAVIASKRRG